MVGDGEGVHVRVGLDFGDGVFEVVEVDGELLQLGPQYFVDLVGGLCLGDLVFPEVDVLGDLEV